MAYAALISLHSTISDLEKSSHISLSSTSLPILPLAFEAIHSLLNTMERLDGSSKSFNRKDVNALDERIKEAVWKVEDLLDSHVYDQIFAQSHILGGGTVVEVHLDELIHDIESFIKMLEEFEKEYIYELDHLSAEEDRVDVDVDVDVDVVSSEKNSKMVGSSYRWTFVRCFISKVLYDPSPEEDVDVVSSATDSGVTNCKLVGSSYILWKIRYHLEMKSSMEVVSLVGMAGIGKTALAKKIFDDPLYFTGFEFECRAWVTIGRKWEPEKLKRDIQTQLKRNKGCYLNRILKPKRCLFVLDDVWDHDLWDHFRRSFPTCIFDGTTLVLLTTRLRHVAGYAESNIIYDVELLNDDQSWDLLRQRVFGEEESCPPELEKPGKKIAEECDGLPLMIITIAELLRQAEMTEEYWESVAKKRNSPIFMTAYDRLYEVLIPSYEYLPQHLKPCFLYMGVFLQSWGFRASLLFDMWIAEGFFLPNERVEEYSEMNLVDLFYHSVLIVAGRSLHYFGNRKNREMKYCRLQSAFWHLCKREATNTKFSHVLSTLVDVQHSMIYNQRRLSFHNNILLGINNLSDFVGDVCASTARSLILHGPRHPYPVPICFNLRLLKVLEAIHIRFYEFPILVFRQVHLRYISLTYNGKLPATIYKLWNLRFLIIYTHMIIKHCGVTLYMPIEIWDMKQLKHLQVMGSNLPYPSHGTSLEKLLSLKGVGVETCTKEVLERIPNLKKLGIRVDLHPGDDDAMKALHCLNHVHVLRELTSLTCSVWNPILRPETIIPALLPMLPSSLKKLHLKGTGYPWSYMSVIGSLPHLQVLKLRSYAFRGSEWVVKDGQFQSLGVLVIYGTDLVKFKVEVGGFSALRRLVFSNCYKLRDVQWEVDQISPLIIQVQDCSTKTVAFANEHNSRRESHIPEEHRVKHVTCSYMK